MRTNYHKIFEIIFVISVLFVVLIIGVIIGTIVFELEPSWAIFPIKSWIIAGIYSTGFFILLDFFFFYHCLKGDKCNYKKTKIEYSNGKKIYVYTNPKELSGGIFSKTYMQVEEDTYICVKSPMILTGQLQWQID